MINKQKDLTKLKACLFLYSVIIFSLFFIPGAAVAQFSGGSGEVSDPYHITTVVQLDNVRNHFDKHFILMNDIDLKDFLAQSSAGWSPIGNIYYQFTGTFNGNNKKITNLKINRSEDEFVGFFGVLGENGKVEKLGIEIDPEGLVAGGKYVGAIAGGNVGEVIQSYSTGAVAGNDYVGGLIGINVDIGTVTKSYTDISVTGNDFVGGLIGGDGGTVAESYSTGDVTGNNTVAGGLIGYKWNGTITDSYTSGSVTGNDHVGGLIGFNIGIVFQSHTNVSATGNDHVGGLMGSHNGTVTKSHSSGSATGNAYVGGLIGTSSGMVSQSYTESSATGNDHVGGLIGGDGGTVAESYSTGDVVGNNTVAGGLIGYKWNGTITDSHSTGSVTGNEFVGGLVGINWNSTITMSYTTDSVTGLWFIGGLAGGNAGLIEQSHSDAIVEGENAVGGLVGANVETNSGTLTQSYFEGSVNGMSFVGGTVGYNRGGTVAMSYSNADVISGTEEYHYNNIGYRWWIGGFVGWNDGKIDNCYSKGTVEYGDAVGGFAGRNEGEIKNSYSENSVTGNGGFVGWNGDNGLIKACYSIGNVRQWNYFGGFAGYNTGLISNCYSKGSATRIWGHDNTSFGGFCGNNYGGIIEYSYSTGRVFQSTGVDWSLEDKGFVGGEEEGGIPIYESNFFDSDASGQNTGTGATAQTTVNMKNQSTFDSLWDFKNTWAISEKINDGYPYLLW